MNKQKTLAALESIGLSVPDSAHATNEKVSHSSVEPRTEFVFQELVAILRPECIVEFGSWEGRSALAWAFSSENCGLSPIIVCVDTWLGSAEHWLDEVGVEEWKRTRLRLVNGEPRIYETFASAAQLHGTSCTILPFRTTTVAAAEVFTKLGVAADIVYVDAAHDYDSVLLDLWGAAKFLSPQGIICCDDFLWENVRRTGISFCLSSGCKLYEKGPHAVLARPSLSEEVVCKFTAAGWTKAKTTSLVHEQCTPPYHVRRYGQIWGVRDLIKAMRGL